MSAYIGFRALSTLHFNMRQMYQDEMQFGSFQLPEISEPDTSSLIQPDLIETDFPSTTTKNGKTMACLEQALLDAFDLGHLGGDMRDQKIAELREQVIEFKGSLLKAGDELNAPIVADTYIDRHGDFYYKFLVTWKMRVIQTDGPDITIAKKQWVVTGVPQADQFDDTTRVFFEHYRALLAVKCHLFIHKNGFDKSQRQHDRILRCIDDVRQNSFVGPDRLTFTTDILDVDCKVDPDSSYQLDNSISPHEPATALCVVLKNATDKKVCVYIDQAFTGRKLNESGTAYEKVRFDPEHPTPEITPLCLMRQHKAHNMLLRGNAALSYHLQALQAGPDELGELLETPFKRLSNREMTFDQVVADTFDARLTHRADIQLVAERAKKSLESTITSLYNQHESNFTKSIKSSIGMKFKKNKFIQNMIEKLKTSHLTQNQRVRLAGAINLLSNAKNLLQSEDQCLWMLGSKCGISIDLPNEIDYQRYDNLILAAESI